MTSIKIIYDNVAMKEGVEPEWGFSALVEHNGRRILFDTGGDADILAANMKKLGIDPSGIEKVFISHEHWDHIGGLAAVKAGRIGAEKFSEVLPGFYSTGMLKGKIDEQSLVLDTDKGLVVITGCSHPGIVNIIRHVKDNLKKDIFMVIGGFHLYEMNKKQAEEIIQEIKELGVKKTAPCHCTGEKAVSLFEQKYQKDFIKIGAGSIIDTSRL